MSRLCGGQDRTAGGGVLGEMPEGVGPLHWGVVVGN
jgi:hypothetical protein